MGSVPNATQDELMEVDPMYFEPTSWEPLNPVGKIQYVEFVMWMIKRVQYNQCTWLECRRLIDLIATEHNWDFMNLAMEHLPKLAERHPRDKKNFGRGFLWLLRPRYGQRMWDKARNNFIPEHDRHVMGLSRAEVEFLKRNLFGPRQRGDYEHMDRLFRTTFELPQPAWVQEAKERGTDIERDVDGLLMNLHIAERPQEPLAGPPGIQCAPAERADFGAYYNRPNDDFLRYIQKPGQALEPPAQTMPGPGLVAAGSKSKVKVSKVKDSKVKVSKVKVSKVKDSKVKDSKVKDSKVKDSKVKDSKVKDSKVKDSKSIIEGRSDPMDISYPKRPK